MAYSSIMSSKGQVTVPQEIRLRLGLKEGDRVEFVDEGGKTVIRRIRQTGSRFREYAGALPVFHSIEEINAWVREMRDPDDESK
ncbi:MAG: AbrB/MazE/SpoVT family DNA-binding domain-containing protein [Bryobacteraceae bacterium]